MIFSVVAIVLFYMSLILEVCLSFLVLETGKPSIHFLWRGGEKKGLGQQTGLVSLCIEFKSLGCERANTFHLGERMMSARVQFAMVFELFV